MNSPSESPEDTAPPLASLMGVGGLIPFFVCAGVAHSGVAPWAGLALIIIGVYGADGRPGLSHLESGELTGSLSQGRAAAQTSASRSIFRPRRGTLPLNPAPVALQETELLTRPGC